MFFSNSFYFLIQFLFTGRVGCDWKTNQISARGNVDFRDGVGSIVLQPGENMTTISIEIIDNKTPELEKMFNVQLYNPTGKGISIGFYSCFHFN